MERISNDPQDIMIRYNATEFKKIDSVLSKYLDIVDLTFLLALFGYKNHQCIPLDADDGRGEHTFSRTVYNKYSVEYDAYFGLFTILTNLEKTYDEVVNKMAFLKTSNTQYKYSQLPSVQTFYGYVLGGIKPLYDICNNYNIDDTTELFDSIYDYLDDELSISSLITHGITEAL